ncbi:hypothetical protein BDM02DRAFT_3273298 [Thelephora ganbajun]|uniref:Uncharacterized protein n=1 Tax=Thelephora ganbajun TaxID=370292 RepID=A0ACB6YZW8_THEGA|nr:hypothetical protein BDM02DRAFT_3273298 [Thelephora ganbajun]
MDRTEFHHGPMELCWSVCNHMGIHSVIALFLYPSLTVQYTRVHFKQTIEIRTNQVSLKLHLSSATLPQKVLHREVLRRSNPLQGLDPS